MCTTVKYLLIASVIGLLATSTASAHDEKQDRISARLFSTAQVGLREFEISCISVTQCDVSCGCGGAIHNLVTVTCTDGSTWNYTWDGPCESSGARAPGGIAAGREMIDCMSVTECGVPVWSNGASQPSQTNQVTVNCTDGTTYSYSWQGACEN